MKGKKEIRVLVKVYLSFFLLIIDNILKEETYKKHKRSKKDSH
jgi:hypothetical protein